MGHRSTLCTTLRRERERQKLTQAALAALAGVQISTVGAAEAGQSRLATLERLLSALGLELRGRSLISGPVGPSLAAARERRKQSRREVALALGVSRNTLASIERGVGLVATLEAYGGAVGAGLYLARREDARAFYGHAGNSTMHHGWETPADLAKLLTEVVGGFDLDPCAGTSDRRRARVEAKILLTVEDDGLAVPWRGKVFVNPPYGRSLKAWVRKCANEASSGETVVVGLVPARTDTRWWHEHVVGHGEAFLLRGRLRFGDGVQAAPFPSAVVVWGGSQDLVSRLATALVGAWHRPR